MPENTQYPEPKDAEVGFRCSEEKKRLIKSEAALRGISIQEMVLQAVEMYLDQETPETDGRRRNNGEQ